MNILLALPLLLHAPEAPPAAGIEAGALMSYAVRVVDCGSLQWRSEFQPLLSFRGYRRGQATWIAPEGTIDALVAHFRDDSSNALVALPDIHANQGTLAVVESWDLHHKVVHAERAAEIGDAPAPARPVVAPVEDGWLIELAGHRAEGGVRLDLRIVESRIAEVHLIETSPKLAEGPDRAVRGTYAVQVPEVYNAEIQGEWTIPEGSGLILSLGIRSSVEDETVTVRERLVLISPKATRGGGDDAIASIDPAVSRASARMMAHQALLPEAVRPTSPAVSREECPVVAPRSIPVAPWFTLPKMPTPVRPIRDLPIAEMPKGMVPSRSLPPAVTPEGETVEPVVPDEAAERTDYQSFVDGRPVPSPQVTTAGPKASPASAPDVDSEVRAASTASTSEAAPSETFRIAISYNYVTGFSLEFKRSKPADVTRASAGEPETRR